MCPYFLDSKIDENSYSKGFGVILSPVEISIDNGVTMEKYFALNLTLKPPYSSSGRIGSNLKSENSISSLKTVPLWVKQALKLPKN